MGRDLGVGWKARGGGRDLARDGCGEQWRKGGDLREEDGSTKLTDALIPEAPHLLCVVSTAGPSPEAQHW